MDEIRIERPGKLYESAVKSLLEYIRSGRIAPGGQFPCERELQKATGISRNVLREAFHILESRGLVYSRQGKGRFLRSLPPSEKGDPIPEHLLLLKLERASLLDIYEVRLVLEGACAEFAAVRSTEDDIRDLVQAYTHFASTLRCGEVKERDFHLHRRYASLSRNPMLERLVILNLDLIEQFSEPEFLKMITEHSAVAYQEEHGAIVDAIRSHDGERARIAMMRHLERTVQMLRAL